MASLIIRNVGPIKHLELNLKKVNVFIGPQSSGKSTIAKILSFCYWIEKQCCLLRQENGDVTGRVLQDKLTQYYSMQGYFMSDSYVVYESDFVSIQINKYGYDDAYLTEDKDVLKTYKRSKILYVPAERCIVSTIPSWSAIKLADNYVKDFITEWGNVRDINANKALRIKPLDIEYRFDKKSNHDIIKTGDRELWLESASSGIQSTVPLALMYDTYKTPNPEIDEQRSFLDQTTLNKVYMEYIMAHTARPYPVPIPETDKFEYRGIYCNVEKGKAEEKLWLFRNYMETQYLQAIIEEPELNLFPDTQQSLVYELMQNVVETDNQLTITTHSPYILFAINNCLMGGVVGDRIPDDVKQGLKSRGAWIDPQNVGIHEIHNGEIRSIQDEDDGTLLDNYLNQAYKSNSQEYLKMLEYYDD